MSEKQEEQQPEQQQDKTKLTVFVGNMSWDTTEEGLQKAFEQYGKITSTRIPKNAKNQSKGFGFVEFETEEEAKKACEMNEKELDGRTIKVNLSQPKSESSHHDRRGDDRRGGYGDRRGYDRRGGDRRGYDRRNDRRGGY